MNREAFNKEVWLLRELMLAALQRRLTDDGIEGGAKLTAAELSAANNFLKMNDAAAPEEIYSNLFGGADDADSDA